MRDIKFRGKAINRNISYHRSNYENGDWVYGLVSKMNDEKYNFPAEMTNENGISGIDVDYKTLGQYTGLKDKNGKEIYEGDIVKINKYQDLLNADKFLIDFEYSTYWFLHLLKYFMEEIEVIGNIYDNPELLNETSEEKIRKGCDE